MAFLRNSAVNRINFHYGIHALAQGAGGIFFLVFLLHAGLPVPQSLLTVTAILVGRFVVRLAVLPFAKRWGLKPMVIFGSTVVALQYPVLAEVHGIGPALVLLCIISSVGDAFYWPAYHAYFAALGDNEHRGHQISAREALASVIGIVAPLLGSWALVTLGPRTAFAAVGAVQALSVLPLFGAPAVAIKQSAPGALRAARLGIILFVADGWLAATFFFVWNIALFLSLGKSFSAYGGAMALSALVGAICGMLLGRHIDAGHGVRAVVIAYTVAAAVILLRAASFGSPWLAVFANALGAVVVCLIVPAEMTAVYNLAKLSPCPLRFHIATDAGWDAGCAAMCLVAAALAAAGFSLSIAILLGLPGIFATALLLRRYYAQNVVDIEPIAIPEVPIA